MASPYHNNMRTLPNALSYRSTHGFEPFTNGQYHHGHHGPIPEALSTKPEGPPFAKTVVSHPIFDSTHHEIKPEISASIQKGFFQVDGKWTCYRRNYFTVACSFTFKPSYTDNRFYLSIHDAPLPIDHFAVSISAKTAPANNQESELRGLVQHTPKRDKATERVPERQPISPAPANGIHQHSHLGSFTGLLPHNMQASVLPDYRFDSQNPSSPPFLHTFERIQFQKATANNGKRRAQQQFFHVVVELSACVTTPRGQEWEVIATKDSEPMVVRGRSPGHYKDGNSRRDSQTSMDRDGHSGPGSEGSGGQFYPHHNHQHHHGSIDWGSRYGGHHHNQHHHGRGQSYGSALLTDASPPSGGSSTTLTESPTATDFALSEADTLKSPFYSLEDSSRATGSDVSDESLFGVPRFRLGRKRPLEEDSTDDGSPFRCSPPFCDSASSHGFELHGISASKVLCAS